MNCHRSGGPLILAVVLLNHCEKNGLVEHTLQMCAVNDITQSMLSYLHVRTTVHISIYYYMHVQLYMHVVYLLRMSSLCLTGSKAYSVESYKGKTHHKIFHKIVVVPMTRTHELLDCYVLTYTDHFQKVL